MTLQELERVQQINTEILFDIVDVCEKNDIEYFLLFGTLLGAVRHKGNIPWDDDVDIGMTMENYDRFLDCAARDLNPRNVLYIMGSGSRKNYNMLKIGRKGTRMDMPGTEAFSVMHEIQVDVFVIQPVRDKGTAGNARREKWNKLYRLIKLNGGEKALIKYNIDTSNARFKWVFKAGLTLLHGVRGLFGEEFFERKIQKNYWDKTGESAISGTVDDPSLFDGEIFDHVVKLEYNGRMLDVPSGYRGFLETAYGDYMQLPPPDKRYRPHFDEVIFEEKEPVDSASV